MKTENGELIAVVANQIIRAAYTLHPWQRKMIFYCIAQIGRDDKNLLEYRITAADFIRDIDATTNGDSYRRLETCADSLLRTVLHIRINEGDRTRRKFQWLSKCDYEDGNGAVNIKFNDELKPWLTELSKHFTQLRLQRMFRLRSGYSIRFFERIEMQRGLSQLTWTIHLSELREWLGLEVGSYASFPAFRTYVLDAAQRELDAKSDWSFSFVAIKTGRKITGIEFTLRPSRTPKMAPSRDRWKKASPALKALLIENARNRPVWEGKEEAEILGDVRFWENLPMILDEVERGQKALSLD